MRSGIRSHASSPGLVHRRGGAAKWLSMVYGQRYLQVMALLGVAWMLVFNYIPMYGIIIAFKEFSIIKPVSEAPWVGLEHFRAFLEDDSLLYVVKNTLGMSFLKLLIGFPLPILFALFLNELQSVGFKKSVQTISYLPHFLSWVILGGILSTWLADVGIVNKLLLALGVITEPLSYLAEPDYFWGIVVSTDIWKELGWSAIIYLAAISSVSPELYEAATMDGAGRFQKMWFITLPSIQGTITILFILAISGVLNSNFDQILVLRNSLNESASTVIDVYVYQMGIVNSRYSYATAVGLIKSLIALALLVGANYVTKKLNNTSLF
ncbi:ABC transporter permease [Paenibacillus mucilaginosus]|uniref:Binding-protein-dependent transport systems inner membrane component n=2 Tax=Paenibacillus mucilaginosus TaxID=61624 RepID=H6NN91_9BACL|nr:ABC transporter permease subunit [Paenibacillus mucilaginosus]AEI44221.1 binding-protein-dependent transport systems inner membrane component [Paenibacillus mucilaginosus KNP414]AFC31767.1 binding-protein-dependent transport systems inner membrane component [Paenibacillus mucilaginosus 3016]MCG7216632.1 ABC transporter permease subunit [Paenibacillus mucilaginosus]WDM25629.1 sugar ABC transporter permease [Paenibacillus mucilaginosus]WFA20285.1 sugar ABC transporter permease [Paenibacillus 